MNFHLFQAIYGFGSVPMSLIAASISEDDIGVLLRIHLVSEQFLQAYISAAIDKGDLFSGDTIDKEKIKMSYFSKLKCAQKHSLPAPTFDALSRLNSERNSMAHEIGKDKISIELIESLESCAQRLDNHSDNELSQQKMQTWDENGKPLRLYSYRELETPNRVKLLIVFSCIVRRTLETIGMSLNNATNYKQEPFQSSSMHPHIKYSAFLQTKKE